MTMTEQAVDHAVDPTDALGARVTVEVRCFAASREALGFSARRIVLGGAGDAGDPSAVVTVSDVVAHLAAETPSAEPVLARCSLLLDGRRVEASQAMPDGATLDLLPPFAGG
jgi:molybdopterin synthase sulfur carrier subunit